MNPAMKAALLSGLVLPGLGQIYLKRYLRGIILMFLVLAGLGYIIGATVISALDSLQKMQGQGAIDMGAISRLAASPPPPAPHLPITTRSSCLLPAAGCFPL